MPPLISEEEIDTMDSGDESDDDHVSTDMLEDICDGSQSHLNVTRREERDFIKKDNWNGKDS